MAKKCTHNHNMDPCWFCLELEFKKELARSIPIATFYFPSYHTKEEIEACEKVLAHLRQIRDENNKDWIYQTPTKTIALLVVLFLLANIATLMWRWILK